MRIDYDNLTHAQQLRVWTWLQANGCRWYVPKHRPILVHGRWIIAYCYPVKVGQKPTHQQWRKWNQSDEIPTQMRLFRNRVPLRLGRS